MNPGSDLITFSVRGPTVGRNADGIAQYDPTVTPVPGCFLQDTSLHDKVSDTEFAESSHRCISPGAPAVIAVQPEDTLTDVNGVHYRVQGKRVYRTWSGRLDHVTVYCLQQDG